MGIMITTAFLSMWISNSASTAMMLPIVSAVLQQLNDTEAKSEGRDCSTDAESHHQYEQTVELEDVKEIVEREIEAQDSDINTGM